MAQPKASNILVRIEIPFGTGTERYRTPSPRASVADLDAYVDALGAEIAAAGPSMSDRHAIAVRIAGPCPSLMGGDRIERIVHELRDALEVDKDAEITVEALPGSLSVADLLSYRRAGASRISLSYVADTPKMAELTGRFADANNTAETMHLATMMRDQDAFDMRVAYGLPHMSAHAWDEEISRVCAWNPRQIALIPFKVEKGSQLWADLHGQEHQSVAIDTENHVSEPLEAAGKILHEAGYEDATPPFEKTGGVLSPTRLWAKPQAVSAYSCMHLCGAEEIGFGVSAASTYDGVAYENTDDLADYLAHSADIRLVARNIRAI